MSSEIGSSTESCPDNADEPAVVEEEKVSYIFNIYFDGTKNNRTNTRERINDTDRFKRLSWTPFKGVDMASYENALSNIALLEELTIYDYPFKKCFYIEGIGTNDKVYDDLIGAAFGRAGTGVRAKVKKCHRKVVDHVKRTSDFKVVEKITFNAFGFSRGAAAARNFIHRAYVDTENELRAALDREGVTVDCVEVNFIGLFDTVAAHGSDEEDDTADLKLDSVQHATRTFQLAASEEYRKKFSLTDIASAGGKGKQVYLPGVHSDIGGGYRDPAKEKNVQVFDVDGTGWNLTDDLMDRDRKWLVKRGWYREEEISCSIWTGEIEASRSAISNKYNRIPLDIMAQEAMDNQIEYKAGDLLDRTFIPDDHPLLGRIKSDVDSYVAICGSGDSVPEDWWREDKDYKDLRHDYLHFSAVYGSIGMAPRWEPDIQTGERQRNTLDG